MWVSQIWSWSCPASSKQLDANISLQKCLKSMHGLAMPLTQPKLDIKEMSASIRQVRYLKQEFSVCSCSRWLELQYFFMYTRNFIVDNFFFHNVFEHLEVLASCYLNSDADGLYNISTIDIADQDEFLCKYGWSGNDTRCKFPANIIHKYGFNWIWNSDSLNKWCRFTYGCEILLLKILAIRSSR